MKSNRHAYLGTTTQIGLLLSILLQVPPVSSASAPVHTWQLTILYKFGSFYGLSEATVLAKDTNQTCETLEPKLIQLLRQNGFLPSQNMDAINGRLGHQVPEKTDEILSVLKTVHYSFEQRVRRMESHLFRFKKTNRVDIHPLEKFQMEARRRADFSLRNYDCHLTYHGCIPPQNNQNP